MAPTMIAPVASSFLLVRADVDGKKRLITRDRRVGWAQAHRFVSTDTSAQGGLKPALRSAPPIRPQKNEPDPYFARRA